MEGALKRKARLTTLIVYPLGFKGGSGETVAVQRAENNTDV